MAEDHIVKFKRTVEGQEIEITLHGTGRFTTDAEWMPQYTTYGTLADLEEKAAKIMKVARVEYAIPVIIPLGEGYGGRHYARAILRGQHTRTRDYLMTINGKKEMVSHPNILAKGGEVTDAQIKEINALADLANDALKAYTDAVNEIRPYRERPNAKFLLAEAAKEAGNIDPDSI